MKYIFCWIMFLVSFALCPALAETTPLFNGQDLSGWRIADITGHGQISVLPDGTVVCEMGNPITAISYTNRFPTMNYELTLDAMRVKGADFFVALTLPVETNFCTVIIGGWGGGLCGISSIDYMDASENQFSDYISFENGRWYSLRVRVTPGVMQVFLDDERYTARVEFESSSRFSLRPGTDIDKTVPLGLATYQTLAHWRYFNLTRITKLLPEDKPRGEP